MYLAGKIHLHKVKILLLFSSLLLWVDLKFDAALYDAMVLARRPADRVQKEFKVDSVVRASMTSGSAMDIVYIQLGNMKPQVILIVFFAGPIKSHPL